MRYSDIDISSKIELHEYVFKALIHKHLQLFMFAQYICIKVARRMQTVASESASVGEQIHHRASRL